MFINHLQIIKFFFLLPFELKMSNEYNINNYQVSIINYVNLLFHTIIEYSK